MNERIDFDKAKTNIEEKLKHGVDVVANTISNGVQYGLEHPEMVIAFIGATATLARSCQSLSVNHRIKTERKRIDHQYYDPSTGMHWELCRKATNKDRAEILRRKANGENLYDILRQLRLIKN